MCYRLIAVLLISIGFSACKEENPALPDNLPAGKKVVILNEGNFQWGNASMSVYYPDRMEVVHKVFQNRNGRPLGDVAQSVTLYHGRYYVVVNNSGSVLVLDTSDFSLLDEWKGFTSPRYLFHVDDQTALVSDLYARGVHVVNKTDGSIVKKIPVNGWTDRMIRLGDDVLVTNRDGAAIYRINLAGMTVTDSISVSNQPNQMVMDVSGRLWVLCSGKTGEGKGALWVINPSDGTPVRKFDMKVSAFVNHLAIDQKGEYIYYIAGNLFKMHYADTVQPASPFVSLDMQTPYGLTVSPLNNDIYIPDAGDFLSKSAISRYNLYGEKVDAFDGGVIAGEMIVQ